ncbi:HAMP domain-containing sensor histidine kinase [Peptostreptococcus stomatis]|uniref:sensor histidine kinase n=1 Tax=Peptostreptococcus stomatis TaxID=341694 RepID=UPI0028DBBB5D|nr:HAMP domain-containing sensor histidine kinase [Peptostreptococcus stomatis]
MFLKKKKKSKNQSIVAKVTLWYTIFVSCLFILMFSTSFTISGSWSNYLSQSQLEHETMDLSSDIDDFKDFEDGIYFAIYSHDKKLERGTLPKGFDENAPFESGKLSKYSSSQADFYYFDVYNAEAQKWVRGIRPIMGLSKELSLFFLSLAIIAPVSILIMIFGGKRILTRAFLQIKDLSQMAEDITESRDYTKRLIPSDRHLYTETERLTKVFNKMLSSIQTNFEKEKQFNQNVSHELRTPLSVILAESEYGEKYTDKLEDSKESLAIINRQARLMKRMTEQILDLTKTQQLDWADLDKLSLSNLVSDFCIGQERKWSELPIKVEIAIEPDLWIRGYELLLIRMLDNLLSNAFKFTKSKVSISLETSQARTLLKVADDGIGIPPDHLDKIWDRFYQVEGSRNKSVNNGLGLGLSFVKSIADLHRAEMDLISEEGKGSIFIVSFPTI